MLYLPTWDNIILWIKVAEDAEYGIVVHHTYSHLLDYVAEIVDSLIQRLVRVGKFE